MDPKKQVPRMTVGQSFQKTDKNWITANKVVSYNPGYKIKNTNLVEVISDAVLQPGNFLVQHQVQVVKL